MLQQFLGSLPYKLILILLVTFTVDVRAQNRTVTACFDNWYPYSKLHKESGEIDGISIELIDLAAKKLGLMVAYQNMPFQRCMLMVQKNEMDMIIGVSPSEGVKQGKAIIAHWIISYLASKNAPWNLVSDLPQNKSLHILVPAEYSYPPEVSTHASRIAKKFDQFYFGSYTDRESLRVIRLIEKRRADLLLEDKLWMELFIKQHSLSVKILEPALFVESQFIGYSDAKFNELGLSFDKALQAITSNTRDEIFIKYTGKTEQQIISQKFQRQPAAAK